MTEQAPTVATTTSVDPVLDQRVDPESFLAWFTPDVQAEAHFTADNSEDEDGLRTVGDYLADLQTRIERMVTGDIEALRPVPSVPTTPTPLPAGAADTLATTLTSSFEDYEDFEFRATPGDTAMVDLYRDGEQDPSVRVVVTAPTAATIVHDPAGHGPEEPVTASDWLSLRAAVAGIVGATYFI